MFKTNNKIFSLFTCTIILQWLFLSLISLTHLFKVTELFFFSTFFLGVMGWIAIFTTVIFLGRTFLKEIIAVFFIFLCIGYYIGPYLEPPGDPIDHLNRTYSFINKPSDQLEKMNFGFWHYSMSSVVMGKTSKHQTPESILFRIDLLHGIYLGFLMAGLFILSKNAGLPSQWSFLSVLIALLFLGTNRFSYFSYYTLAPSASSLLIYWLWTATFFFKRNWNVILLGMLLSCISLPILVVNHVQEAIFMGFITFIWVFWNAHERIWKLFQSKHLLKPKYIYLLCLIFILFILPQFVFFQKLLSQFFVINDWHKNQEVVFSWHNLHLIGKIWSFRVNDTLGLIGILPVFLGIGILWPNIHQLDKNIRKKIIILGILPLIMYLIPLFHFIWVSNCKRVPTYTRYYYRICYSSMFWIPIVYFLYSMGDQLKPLWEKMARIANMKIKNRFTNFSFGTGYFTICLIGLIMISSIRSGPVYGKMDFLLLETRPWWNEWKPMIHDIMNQERKPVHSDPVTGNVLNGVFNLPVATGYRGNIRKKVFDINKMIRRSQKRDYLCLINLHGFSPSWMAEETAHWDPDIARTSQYYQYDGLNGRKLKKLIKERPFKQCEVYY